MSLPPDFQWGDPEPARDSYGTMNGEVQRVLRKHPDRWASLGLVHAVSNASYMRKTFGPRGFEFTTRLRQREGKYELFARYSPLNVENYDPEQDVHPGVAEDTEPEGAPADE